MKSIHLIFTTLLLLTACEDGTSLSEICEKKPEFCEDLNSDGWCRNERYDLISQRYFTALQPNGEMKYKLLINLENYRNCISKAAQIELNKGKQRASNRNEAYLASLAQIEALTKETKGDQTPNLLYYHWSREGDQQAFQQLLELDKQGKLERPDMQVHLASHFAKSDPQIAVNKLYKALYLNSGQSDLDANIITLLATIFTQQRKTELAYLWLKVGEIAEIKSIDIEASSRYLPLDSQQRASIDEKAEEVFKSIEKGEFSLPEPNL